MPPKPTPRSKARRQKRLAARAERPPPVLSAPYQDKIDAGVILANLSVWQVDELVRKRKLRAKRFGRRIGIETKSILEYAASAPWVKAP